MPRVIWRRNQVLGHQSAAIASAGLTHGACYPRAAPALRSGGQGCGPLLPASKPRVELGVALSQLPWPKNGICTQTVMDVLSQPHSAHQGQDVAPVEVGRVEPSSLCHSSSRCSSRCSPGLFHTTQEESWVPPLPKTQGWRSLLSTSFSCDGGASAPDQALLQCALSQRPHLPLETSSHLPLETSSHHSPLRPPPIYPLRPPPITAPGDLLPSQLSVPNKVRTVPHTLDLAK